MCLVDWISCGRLRYFLLHLWPYSFERRYTAFSVGELEGVVMDTSVLLMLRRSKDLSFEIIPSHLAWTLQVRRLDGYHDEQGVFEMDAVHVKG